MFQNLWPIVVVVLMVAAGILLARLLAGRQRMPYSRRKKLVTKAEFRFYRDLRDAVDGDWEIFAMVRLADLIRVEKGVRNYRSWLNKILSKHIDFVLCNKDNLDVVLAIELDDASHSRPDRKLRDQFIDNAFQDAQLPLLRVETQRSYDATWLRSLIDEAIAG